MSLAQILADIKGALGSSVVQEAETVVNTVSTVVAAAVPAAAPIVAAVQTAEAVANTVVNTVAVAASGATITPPAVPSTTLPAASATDASGTDSASAAAASIAANPDSNPLVARIQALESAVLSLLTPIATIAHELGLG